MGVSRFVTPRKSRARRLARIASFSHHIRPSDGIGASFLGRSGRGGSHTGTHSGLPALTENLSAIAGCIISALSRREAPRYPFKHVIVTNFCSV